MQIPEIIEKIHQQRTQLDPFPLQLIYLHGSTANGTATPISDIDFALVVNPDIELQDYLDMELNLEVVLCRILNTDKAEARIINQAPLGFQGQVLTKGVLAYSRDEEFRVEFETRTRMRYFDFLPVIEQMNAAYFSGIKKGCQHGQSA